MTTLNELTTDELIDNFELLGDWESRFTYLLDLGKKVPKLPEADLVEVNKVHGCQSQVWLTAEVKPTEPPTIEFLANSDAHIVNGLIAILLTIYNGRTVDEFLSIDAESILRKLDLEEHLSPTRRNGLHAMVKRIRSFASSAASSPQPDTN